MLPPSVGRILHKHRVRPLEERLKAGDGYADNGFVFASETGLPLHRNNLTVRHFKPLLRKARLPDIRIYDLRHSGLAIGENPKIVAEMLRHASVVLPLDTYSHVLPEMQRASESRLVSLLFFREYNCKRVALAFIAGRS